MFVRVAAADYEHEMLNDWISAGGALDKRGRIDASGIMQPIAQLPAAARSENVRVASDGIAPSNPVRLEDAMQFINSLAIVKHHNEVIELWNKR